MARTAVIVVSDLHVNSKVALCTPTVNLDEGGTYRASRTQRALWDAWLDFWKTMNEYDCRKVLFLNGDVGELDTKRRSAQLITPNKATILEMVSNVLEPAVDNVDSVVVLKGTSAHSGKSAWLETAVANDLDHALHGPEEASWWHFRGKIEGVPFDVCHHSTMGYRPWTEKNAANSIASVMIYRYTQMESPIPRFAFRAHNHRRSDSGRNFQTRNYKLRVICGPSWSSKTEFAYRKGHENDVSDIGGDVVICGDGEPEWIDHRYHPLPEGRRIWSIKV
jgi:hypothetical protein